MPRIGLLNHNAHAWSKSLIEGVRCFIREQNDWVPVPCGPESVVDRELVGGLGLDALLGFYQEDAMPRDMSDLPPFVTWSGVSPIEGIVQVIPDHRRSAEFVAEHLYSRGYRVLACFEHQNPRRIGARIREDRLKELAGELGCGYHRFTSGLNTSDRWSLHGQVADLADWLRALPTPVGVMCSDDYHSWRILEAANRVGLNVPNDIGLVGCRNDVDFSESTRSTLSSIALDGFGQGYEACVQLDSMLRGEPPPEHPVLVPPLGVIGRESTGVSVSHHPEIRSALRFIRQHLPDDIGVADVARHIGVSTRTTQRLFTEHLGRSPSEEIRLARINKALELLRGSGLQMVEIAIESGYSHTSYLSSAVKRTTGLTPTQYRRRFGISASN